MATYKATIGNCNGYTGHEVEISGVTTQAAAKRAIEATHPGASIRAVRFISSTEWETAKRRLSYYSAYWPNSTYSLKAVK